ncbi:MAG: hypothetical protein AB1768_00615 [Pseudomonadota bacterium]
MKREPAKHGRAEWLVRLARIEEGVDRIPTRLAFTGRWYTLRSHIDLVRAVILEKTAA